MKMKQLKGSSPKSNSKISKKKVFLPKDTKNITKKKTLESPVKEFEMKLKKKMKQKQNFSEEEDDFEDLEEDESEDLEEDESEDLEEDESEDLEEEESEDLEKNEDEDDELEDEDDELEDEELEDEDDELHENSDETDEELEDEDDDQPKVTEGNVTQSMIQKWSRELDAKPTVVSAVKQVQLALSAAVASIKGSSDEEVQSPYVVKGSQIFNGIIRLCLKKVLPTLHQIFELKTLSDRPARNKKWTKLIPNIKKYLKDFILLIKSISEPSVIATLLKRGVLPLLPFYSELPGLSWRLTKHLSSLWCTSNERVRVLSLVALLRLFRSFNEEKRDKALKLLYISFVNNCRFTSPMTWPMIDFMRMSLVELYGMDQAIAYRHSFIYIRQLAFHLRNAMIVQTKDRLQLVYNWQYVHCLHFWANLLAKTHPSPVLQPLIYPLTQIANGVMTFMKSTKHFPLTFHICNILTDLSLKTDIFIPVLPHLLEILSSQPLRVRPSKASLKPLQWDCIIKVSKSQLKESAFSEGLLEQFFDCTLYYLNSHCNSISFPELVFPLTLQVKAYIKKCKVQNNTRKLKQLMEKVNANTEFINNRRKHVTFSLTDTKAIQNWEIETLQSGPPLRTFFLHWKGVKEELKKREAPMEQEEEEEEDIFSISAVRKRQREGQEDCAEDDFDLEEKMPPSKKRKEQPEPRNAPKRSEGPDSSDLEDEFEEDIVQEMKLSDYEDDED